MSALTDWENIYESYSGTEQAEERERLKSRIKGFNSQTTGDKSYAQNMDTVRQQFAALSRVMAKKSQGSTQGRQDWDGVADFSRGLD